MTNETLCPKCNSKEVIKRGILKTENKGKRQRLGCKTCNHRFIIDEPFFRMRNHENMITACMDMYYSGMSLRKIRDHLEKFYPNSVTHSTIYRWIIKYVEMMATFTDKQEMHLGNHLESDEVEFNRRIKHDKKGFEKNWFIEAIDTKTKYITFSTYVRKRTPKTITGFYRKVKQRTGNQIEIISTDGFLMNPRALRKTFGLKKTYGVGLHRQKSKIIHRVVKSDSGKFNYIIERFHNTLRERTKIMRGFHGCVSSTQSMLKGFEIYYNWIRKNMSLKNESPCSMAIPQVELTEKNRWIELINKGYD